MKRVNNTLYDIIDSHTGENFNYDKVTTYADGSAMSDAKCDGVIYRKLGSEYFKRNFTGAVNVKWFGAKGDGVTDDTVAIQKALDSIGFNGILSFERYGTYKVSQTLNIYGDHKFIDFNDCSIYSYITDNSIIKIGYSDILNNRSNNITLKNLNISGANCGGENIGYDISGMVVNLVLKSLKVEDLVGKGFNVQSRPVAETGFENGAYYSSYYDLRALRCSIGFNIQGIDGNQVTSQNYYTCTALRCTGTGWKFTNTIATNLIGCSSETNTGYGYDLDNCSAFCMIGGFCEVNTLGNFNFQNIPPAAANVVLSYGAYHNPIESNNLKDIPLLYSPQSIVARRIGMPLMTIPSMSVFKTDYRGGILTIYDRYHYTARFLIGRDGSNDETSTLLDQSAALFSNIKDSDDTVNVYFSSEDNCYVIQNKTGIARILSAQFLGEDS